MQFSIRWILGGMAYVAVAAAAFSRQTWVFADALWAASLLAVVFAVMLAVFARGRRQMAAAGFVVASACFLACMAFDQNSVPTNRLLAGAGINLKAPVQPLALVQPTPVYAPPPRVVTRQRPVTETKMTDSGPVSETRVVEVQEVVTASAAVYPLAPIAPVAGPYYAPTPISAPPMTIGNWMASPAYATNLYRSGRAVGMMGFGLFGCLVGVAAHRAVRREEVGG